MNPSHPSISELLRVSPPPAPKHIMHTHTHTHTHTRFSPPQSQRGPRAHLPALAQTPLSAYSEYSPGVPSPAPTPTDACQPRTHACPPGGQNTCTAKGYLPTREGVTDAPFHRHPRAYCEAPPYHRPEMSTAGVNSACYGFAKKTWAKIQKKYMGRQVGQWRQV